MSSRARYLAARGLAAIAFVAVAACSRAEGSRAPGPAALCADASATTCRLSDAWRAWVDAAPATRRDLMRYAVKCAPPEGSSVEAPFAVLPGAVGLQPSWRTAALDVDGQELVSACLLSMLNAFGEHIRVHLVGPDVPGRVDGFDHLEAVFYGNVFARSPRMFACAGTDHGSPDAAKRICGTPDGPCGIDVVGACDAACVRWAGDAPHRYCAEARGRTGALHRHPLTVYLRD